MVGASCGQVIRFLLITSHAAANVTDRAGNMFEHAIIQPRTMPLGCLGIAVCRCICVARCIRTTWHGFCRVANPVGHCGGVFPFHGLGARCNGGLALAECGHDRSHVGRADAGPRHLALYWNGGRREHRAGFRLFESGGVGRAPWRHPHGIELVHICF